MIEDFYQENDQLNKITYTNAQRTTFSKFNDLLESRHLAKSINLPELKNIDLMRETKLKETLSHLLTKHFSIEDKYSVRYKNVNQENIPKWWLKHLNELTSPTFLREDHKVDETISLNLAMQRAIAECYIEHKQIGKVTYSTNQKDIQIPTCQELLESISIGDKHKILKDTVYSLRHKLCDHDGRAVNMNVSWLEDKHSILVIKGKDMPVLDMAKIIEKGMKKLGNY